MSTYAPITGRRLRRALGVAVDQQMPVFIAWSKKIVPKFTPIFEDMLQLLPATVVHSFEGSEMEARTLLDKGFYLGISCRYVPYFSPGPPLLPSGLYTWSELVLGKPYALQP